VPVQVAALAQIATAEPIRTGNVFTALIGLIVVLAAVYYVTKFIAAKSMGLSKPSGSKRHGGFFSFGNVHRNIKIMDRVNLGREKALVVVVYEGKQYFLAVSDNNIEVIQKSSYREPDETEYRMPDNFMTRFINKQNKAGNGNQSGSFEGDIKKTKKKKKEDGG